MFHLGTPIAVTQHSRQNPNLDISDEIDQGIAGDHDESDAEEEKEIREMQADDASYLEQLASEVDEDERGLPALRDEEEGEVVPRTASPDRMSYISDLVVEPVGAGQSVAMRRNVTIEVPVRDSMEKNPAYLSNDPPELATNGGPGRRRKWNGKRTLSIHRTATSKTFSTFSTFMSDSWETRHDPGSKGFWSGLWRFLVGSKEDASMGPREGDPDYIPPKYRWTPILSGLLQPFSILLEIPGLTEHWYVQTIDNKAVTYRPNPAILDVGLAVSMACAVVANIALISRFLERRVFVSTVVTIVGLTIHDVINITAVTIFGIVHRFSDGFTYSEAFWLCVCSTVASMVTNATLIYDLIKTKDFKRSGSGLTPKQRSLVIIVMVLLVYIAIGALVFNFLLPEINFHDCLYYTVVTIETIGFGDITPTTTGAKIFLFFYEPLGILNLAVAVGTARDTLVESWNATYRRRRHEVLRRHRIRKQQRAEEAIRRVAIERELEAAGFQVYIDTRGGGVRGGAKGRKLNVKALSIDQLNAAESAAMSEIASKQSSAPGGLAPLPEGAAEDGEYQKALADAKRLQDDLTAQTLLSEEGYREFQERMAKEEKMENLIKFTFAFSLFTAFWLVGATVFSQTEGWSWFVGFYFCFVTFATIGYGEVAPKTPAGRAFFIIWAIFGVATVTLLIAVLTEAYANRYKSALVQKGARRAMNAIKEHRTKLSEERNHIPEDLDHHRVERLPYEILEVMKDWHQHVTASRIGVSEGYESEGMRQVVARMMEEQGLPEHEKKELESDAESRKVLFWNGYERAVQRLIGVAETAIRHHESHAKRADWAEDTESRALASRTTRRKDTTLSSVGEGWNSQPDLGLKGLVASGNGLYRHLSH